MIMALGKKIKEARKQAGLSQEQLANKIGVSRSAVAKWESQHEICDVDNLKTLSQLFGVSIDYLLSDDETIDQSVIREKYDLSTYGKGSKKKKKDRAIHDKFPHGKIYTLIGKEKLTKSERVIDNVLGFFTDAPFGIPDFINGMKNLDKEFYLVEEDEKQYLVVLTDELFEMHLLKESIRNNQFELGNWKFTKCNDEMKQKKR